MISDRVRRRSPVLIMVIVAAPREIVRVVSCCMCVPPYIIDLHIVARTKGRCYTMGNTILAHQRGRQIFSRRSYMAQLGFVGLGKMGGRVAKRLLDAGHTVTGYNRTKSKAQWLLDAGMQWGATPRHVAEAADVTFSMVTNTAALDEILNGDEGILAGLSQGKIYIDMSTISVSTSREVAKRVAAKGAQMLDAPVSGNVKHVEEGTASIMIGGEHDIFEKAKPLLQDITSKVSYVGG